MRWLLTAMFARKEAIEGNKFDTLANLLQFWAFYKFAINKVAKSADES